MDDNHMPTPDELDSAPELAVLAALDAAIEASTRAVVAAHPELCDHDGRRSEQDPVVRSAYRLLNRAKRLQDAVARYRQAVLREPPVASDASEGRESFSPGDPGAF